MGPPAAASGLEDEGGLGTKTASRSRTAKTATSPTARARGPDREGSFDPHDGHRSAERLTR